MSRSMSKDTAIADHCRCISTTTNSSNESGDDESQLTQSSATALLEREMQGFTATRPSEYANSVGMPLWEKIR